MNEPSNWTALIVEDDPDNLDLITRVMSYHQAIALVAKNGQQCLDTLTRVIPTFVLMDLSMPVMDGWRVLERIRSMPQTAELPVIAVTAHAMKGDREHVLSCGFDGYIPKPFQISSLVEQIKDCLQQSDSPEPVSADSSSIVKMAQS